MAVVLRGAGGWGTATRCAQSAGSEGLPLELPVSGRFWTLVLACASERGRASPSWKGSPLDEAPCPPTAFCPPCLTDPSTHVWQGLGMQSDQIVENSLSIKKTHQALAECLAKWHVLPHSNPEKHFPPFSGEGRAQILGPSCLASNPATSPLPRDPEQVSSSLGTLIFCVIFGVIIVTYSGLGV